jgi:hypothetical protein
MTQVINDENRTRQSVSISGHGRASTLCEEHASDTTGTRVQDDEDVPNGNGSADEEVKVEASPTPPGPAYEKLAQRNPKPTDHHSITIGPPMIILFDVVLPCMIYYVWYDIHQSQWKDDCRTFTSRQAPCPIEKPEFDDHTLGYAVVSFGIGELYILIARVARLLRCREQCAPLLSRSKWELDATS